MVVLLLPPARSNTLITMIYYFSSFRTNWKTNEPTPRIDAAGVVVDLVLAVVAVVVVVVVHIAGAARSTLLCSWSMPWYPRYRYVSRRRGTRPRPHHADDSPRTVVSSYFRQIRHAWFAKLVSTRIDKNTIYLLSMLDGVE